MIEKNTIWINISNGMEYVVAGVGINATNNLDGQEMVRYYLNDYGTDPIQEYYREIEEFKLKFTEKDMT